MKTKVQKWDNSLVLRIPKLFAAEMALELDAEVDLSLVEGRLVITPVAQSEYSLEWLLSGITEENLHTEVDAGAFIGNEVC